MAYTLRIRSEHHDFEGALHRIDISERDYAGSTITATFEGSNPHQTTWGDRSQSMPVVYGSELRISYISQTDFQFLFLFASDRRKFKVEHYINDQLYWSGYLAPENWGEPLTAPPYIVEATATDGLGALKDEKFTNTESQPYTGRWNLLTIIGTILQKTGLSLPLNTAVNLEETGQTAGTNILAETYKDLSTFEGMDCYEVLETILLNCRIFQRNGEWWVLSNDNFEADTISYFRYTAAASPSYIGTGTTSMVKSPYWIENQPYMEVLPAIRYQIVNQDYGYLKNMILNGSFEKYNEELARFETWDNINVSPQQRILNDDGDKYVYIPGKQYPGWYNDEKFGEITNGIKKQLVVVASSGILNIALKYALMGSAYSCHMYIKVRLVGQTNTYYLRRKPYVEKEAEWEWINWNNKPSLGDAHIPLNTRLKRYGHDVAYINESVLVTAYPHNEITDHFEEFRASVAGIPTAGTLELYLYVPYTNRSEIAGSCFTGVNLELLDENNQQYPEKKAYKATVDENNNYVPDDINLKIGDFPEVPNADIIYSGGLFRSNGMYTTGWRLAGQSTYYTFGELVARYTAAQQNVPRQNYDIRIQGETPGLDMVIIDPDNSNRRLVESGITFDARMQAIEGTYTEVIDTTAGSETIETDTSFNQPAQEIRQPANPRNIEERVTIIDKIGAKVSTPGYLYENDFEIKEQDKTLLEEDGLVRFQIKREAITPYNLDQAAGQLQFSITSVVETNADGNANKLRFAAGKLLIHNWDALDKDSRLTALAE